MCDRWNFKPLQKMGKTLFQKIYHRKRFYHHNHEVHFMARELDGWLSKGIQLIREGKYSPRMLKRRYLPDGMVDCLHLTDRIFQHLLLQIIKPTFKHVINPNCAHMMGPSGVKWATAKICNVLQTEQPKHFIRIDIKSFYKSIVRYKLIQDIKKYYDDNKLISMLENIINNPIDTPYGDINPITGIPLRGPLSQFFSAIYLKILDDAFDNMEVSYIRYQDDILILCKTKRQMNRCRRRMMNIILHERHLKLSRRKSRMGKIEDGFHFLGVKYPPTQTGGNTNTRHVNDNGKANTSQTNQTHDATPQIVPHPRTFRNARENVKAMVADDVSLPLIKAYLFRWCCWWANTSSGIWERKTLLTGFIGSCWDTKALEIAKIAYQHYFKELHAEPRGCTSRQGR